MSHFSELPGTEEWQIQNQHSHLVLVLVLFLLSMRIGLRRRILGFGSILVSVLLLDFISAVLAIQLRTAKTLFEEQGMLLLLPWEFNVVECLWYVLYVVPLQAGPFILLLVTAFWNGAASPKGSVGETPGALAPAPSTSPKLRPLVLGACVLAVAAAAFGASRWVHSRNANPLHQKTHVKLGGYFYDRGALEKARKEYGSAVSEGSLDPEAWFRLSELLRMEGKNREAARLLRRGRLIFQDPRWIRQVERSLTELQRGKEKPAVPEIIAIPPPAN
ncbi:MAG TPA: hypothetical protein VGR67_12495 [Candidatus Polarisedimenticolia bacterium]|jgi:hypothetical protein|nr:hypothetical protein [Candidatus Polarisedimenticolia bacterium]